MAKKNEKTQETEVKEAKQAGKEAVDELKDVESQPIKKNIVESIEKASGGAGSVTGSKPAGSKEESGPTPSTKFTAEANKTARTKAQEKKDQEGAAKHKNDGNGQPQQPSGKRPSGKKPQQPGKKPSGKKPGMDFGNDFMNNMWDNIMAGGGSYNKGGVTWDLERLLSLDNYRRNNKYSEEGDGDKFKYRLSGNNAKETGLENVSAFNDALKEYGIDGYALLHRLPFEKMGEPFQMRIESNTDGNSLDTNKTVQLSIVGGSNEGGDIHGQVFMEEVPIRVAGVLHNMFKSLPTYSGADMGGINRDRYNGDLENENSAAFDKNVRNMQEEYIRSGDPKSYYGYTLNRVPKEIGTNLVQWATDNKQAKMQQIDNKRKEVAAAKRALVEAMGDGATTPDKLHYILDGKGEKIPLYQFEPDENGRMKKTNKPMINKFATPTEDDEGNWVYPQMYSSEEFNNYNMLKDELSAMNSALLDEYTNAFEGNAADRKRLKELNEKIKSEFASKGYDPDDVNMGKIGEAFLKPNLDALVNMSKDDINAYMPMYIARATGLSLPEANFLLDNRQRYNNYLDTVLEKSGRSKAELMKLAEQLNANGSDDYRKAMDAVDPAISELADLLKNGTGNQSIMSMKARAEQAKNDIDNYNKVVEAIKNGNYDLSSLGVDDYIAEAARTRDEDKKNEWQKAIDDYNIVGKSYADGLMDDFDNDRLDRIKNQAMKNYNYARQRMLDDVNQVTSRETKISDIVEKDGDGKWVSKKHPITGKPYLTEEQVAKYILPKRINSDMVISDENVPEPGPADRFLEIGPNGNVVSKINPGVNPKTGMVGQPYFPNMDPLFAESFAIAEGPDPKAKLIDSERMGNTESLMHESPLQTALDSIDNYISSDRDYQETMQKFSNLLNSAVKHAEKKNIMADLLDKAGIQNIASKRDFRGEAKRYEDFAKAVVASFKNGDFNQEKLEQLLKSDPNNLDKNGNLRPNLRSLFKRFGRIINPENNTVKGNRKPLTMVDAMRHADKFGWTFKQKPSKDDKPAEKDLSEITINDFDNAEASRLTAQIHNWLKGKNPDLSEEALANTTTRIVNSPKAFRDALYHIRYEQDTEALRNKEFTPPEPGEITPENEELNAEYEEAVNKNRDADDLDQASKVAEPDYAGIDDKLKDTEEKVLTTGKNFLDNAVQTFLDRLIKYHTPKADKIAQLRYKSEKLGMPVQDEQKAYDELYGETGFSPYSWITETRDKDSGALLGVYGDLFNKVYSPFVQYYGKASDKDGYLKTANDILTDQNILDGSDAVDRLLKAIGIRKDAEAEEAPEAEETSAVEPEETPVDEGPTPEEQYKDATLARREAKNNELENGPDTEKMWDTIKGYTDLITSKSNKDTLRKLLSYDKDGKLDLNNSRNIKSVKTLYNVVMKGLDAEPESTSSSTEPKPELNRVSGNRTDVEVNGGSDLQQGNVTVKDENGVYINRDNIFNLFKSGDDDERRGALHDFMVNHGVNVNSMLYNGIMRKVNKMTKDLQQINEKSPDYLQRLAVIKDTYARDISYRLLTAAGSDIMRQKGKSVPPPKTTAAAKKLIGAENEKNEDKD